MSKVALILKGAPDTMSRLSPELYIMILRCCLNDTADKQSHRKDWLAIRHTSALFKALLLSVDLQDFNPFKDLVVSFNSLSEGHTSFDAVFRGLTRRLQRMNILQSTAPFPITMKLEFLHSEVQPRGTIRAVFDSLECPSVINNLQSLKIVLSTNKTHSIPIPTFPNLHSLYLHLDHVKNGYSGVCCLGQGIGTYDDEPIHFIIRAPKLRMLTIITKNPSIVRVESPRHLAYLSLDLGRVGCRECRKDRNHAQHTLQHMVTRPGTMFDNFGGIASGLTDLDLSVKVSWLDGTPLLQFPNLTRFKLRTTNPTCEPVSGPVTALHLPKVERIELLLCDTRTINFAESSMPKLRALRLFTPCYMEELGEDLQVFRRKEGTWTRNNFLVEYPNLERVVIAVHGIDQSSYLPVPVQWVEVKVVMLAADVGIADMIGDVVMPSLEQIILIYPAWRESGDLYSGGREKLTETYIQERKKLANRFPGIPIKSCSSTDECDEDEYEVMKTATVFDSNAWR